MFWLRLSGWLFVALVLATAAAMLLGSRLPATHTTTLAATLPTTPDRLWPLLTDPDAQPRWRSGLSATAPLPDRNGLPCWTEFHAHLAVPVCITAADAPHHLTLRTTDPRLPTTTERSITLTPAGPNATALHLTETTTTTQPMVRFREHYLPPSASSPAADLAALARLVPQP